MHTMHHVHHAQVPSEALCGPQPVCALCADDASTSPSDVCQLCNPPHHLLPNNDVIPQTRTSSDSRHGPEDRLANDVTKFGDLSF